MNTNLIRATLNLTPVMSPLLDHIPSHIWKSSTTTFIDPAAGGGQCLLEVINKLRAYGHSDENIKNRIFGVFHNKIARGNAEYIGVIGTLVIETSSCDILRINYMNFNVSVGNPPYQDASNPAKNNKLWNTIVSKTIRMISPGGYIAFVTPSSIIGETSYGKKMLKLCQTDAQMHFIDYTVGQTYFPTIGVPICAWVLEVTPTYTTTNIVTNEATIATSLKLGRPKTKDEEIRDSILDKIDKCDIPRIPLQIGDAITDTPNGKYAYYHSGQKIRRSNKQPSMSKELKFVIPFSASYTNFFTTNGYIGMLNMWCPINNEAEKTAYERSMNSPIVQFFITHYRRTAGFTPAVKNSRIPIIPNDEKVQELFKLTEEELAYVKSHIK